MAATDPGAQVVARGAEDVALKLQSSATTRDALLDPREGDIIPDIESKGYHVGDVRQPADPVLLANGVQTFESQGGVSKFQTAADQKAIANAREAENPHLYGGDVHVPISVDSGDITGVGSAERLRARGIEVRDDAPAPKSSKSAAKKLDADAADVAADQAADDKS